MAASLLTYTLPTGRLVPPARAPALIKSPNVTSRGSRDPRNVLEHDSKAGDIVCMSRGATPCPPLESIPTTASSARV